MAYQYKQYNPRTGQYDTVTIEPGQSTLPVNGTPFQAPMMPQQPVMQQPVMQQQPNIVCRPVASEDEAKAVPTEFDGRMTVMTDLSHGNIYTKVLDPRTGSAVFDKYSKNQPAPQIQYAPIADFQRLEQEVIALREELAESKKAVKKPVGKAAE